MAAWICRRAPATAAAATSLVSRLKLARADSADVRSAANSIVDQSMRASTSYEHAALRRVRSSLQSDRGLFERILPVPVVVQREILHFAERVVDVYSNNQHCGGCDIACPAGTQCNYGTCTCTQAGYTLCGSTCYDLANDPRHCGSCTNSCPGNYTCTGGQWKCPDPTVGTAVRLTNNSIDEYVPAVAFDGRTSVSPMPKAPAASRPTCASHCSIPTALSYLTRRLPPTPATECRADPVSRGRAPSTPWSGTTRARASCSNVSTQLEPPKARRSMSPAARIHLKTPR